VALECLAFQCGVERFGGVVVRGSRPKAEVIPAHIASAVGLPLGTWMRIKKRVRRSTSVPIADRLPAPITAACGLKGKHDPTLCVTEST
jgi:hypothetical protein